MELTDTVNNGSLIDTSETGNARMDGGLASAGTDKPMDETAILSLDIIPLLERKRKSIALVPSFLNFYLANETDESESESQSKLDLIRAPTRLYLVLGSSKCVKSERFRCYRNWRE